MPRRVIFSVFKRFLWLQVQKQLQKCLECGMEKINGREAMQLRYAAELSPTS